MQMAVKLGCFRTVKPALVLLAVAISACAAKGQSGFVEDFTGASFDPNEWNIEGDPNGHPTTVAGTYDISDAFGPPGVKLGRFTPGVLSSYTHEIEVVLDPHLLGEAPGTQSDFKWKSFGSDGFMELVLNSFGDLRLFHVDNTDPNNVLSGNLQPNTDIGYTDGDTLKITTDYDLGTDTIDVTYSLNGGSASPYYSGTGHGGSIGDLITSFVEVELFKWGTDPNQPTPQAVVSIDNWSLVPDSIAGDFNFDGFIDGLDFLLWQENPSVGNLSDWETNYGAQPLSASIGSVPEPSGILLMLTSAAMLGPSRRSRRTI